MNISPFIQESDWPHQKRGLTEVEGLLGVGASRICLTGPTGSGKSRIIGRICQAAHAHGDRAVLTTIRKSLIPQMRDDLLSEGVHHGVIASEFPEWSDPDAMIQLCMEQTLRSRVYEHKSMLLPQANYWIKDEAHLQKSGTSQRIQADYDAREPFRATIDVTATPLGIYEPNKRLVIAGTNSELRETGALVPARYFTCVGMDPSSLRPTKTGEYSINGIMKEIWSPTIVGYVIQDYRRLNPDRLPALAFFPDVASSKWGCDRFNESGIKAAHIDGEDCYFQGEEYPSDQNAREQIVEAFRQGEIHIICNRFVLREGINIPEVFHLILVTAIGSLTSFIQICGRALRAHPSMKYVIIQDHGLNDVRHGSPNQDWDWEELWKLTEQQAANLHTQRKKQGEEGEPIACPKCGGLRMAGPACPYCGYRHQTSRRIIITKGGELRERHGIFVRKQKQRKYSDTEQKWRSAYYAARRSGQNFNQAYGWFQRKHGYAPPRNLGLMPMEKLDWHRKVSAVSNDRLY